MVRGVDAGQPAKTIGQVARLTGISAHTLRYYDSVGLFRVPRTQGGRRAYTEAEIMAVRFVTYLRATGMPIRTIKKYADLVREGDTTIPQRRLLLTAHKEDVRARIATEERHLEAITRKIETYTRELDSAEP